MKGGVRADTAWGWRGAGGREGTGGRDGKGVQGKIGGRNGVGRGDRVKEVLGRGEWQERSDWGGMRVVGRVLITGKEG